MSIYPTAYDDDTTIIRVEDQITELGGEAILGLRSAVFSIEQTLGLIPQGSASSLASRLNISLNSDGTIKASALTSVGLATLPITNSQVALGAGIKEQKLALDFSTSNLHSLIISNYALLQALQAFSTTTSSDLSTHIGGGALLTDGGAGRHVASHIDLNATPSDIRDPLFTWQGLKDKLGVLRVGTNVGAALNEINTDLINHENSLLNAHNASAIDLDVSNFGEVPVTINTVQKLADYIDDFDVLTLGEHRATQHANAIPRIARAQGTALADGYKQNVVPSTNAIAYLVHSPNTTPVDSLSIGDDIVKFTPDNSGFVFDSQFSQVKVGDFIRINYGNGFVVSFPITEIKYTSGSEWIVRLNGVNIADGYVSARIDKPIFETDTSGILAVAAANATPTDSFSTILSGLIVGSPRGAVALGLGFDPGQIDSTHYNLWLQLYPTGNPTDRVISLPAIDITGNAGATPGKYTLYSIVQSINDKFRQIGYNYRFIAFDYNGEFGIMLADAINNASFSIISGQNSAGVLSEGTFLKNVIGDASDEFDALGFGNNHADIAGPSYISTFSDATTAQLPTKIIPPLKHRYYIVNGRKRDDFASTWLANDDGYWDGYISERNPIGAFTVETTYTVNLNLCPAGLAPGKTIVIQPTVPFSNSSYFDVDYGRFIIKAVNFSNCLGETASAKITVINSLHGFGSGFGFSSGPALPVRIYFSADSVGFNKDNIIDSTPSITNYHRLNEIFIDDNGKTWDKPRSRVLVQSETVSKLRTDIWHIEDVSSKLRGYRDSSATFNKYVRFYILSYDTDTGEYDGYIGKRIPAANGILNVGPVTRGRKNITSRFYDETYVDFIDLKFVEDSTASPGISVLSDGISGGGGTPRYVDIEVFDSLRNHDEFFLLATCEVNWSPLTGQDVIERVVNRRNFGSVDESDFTDSALDFISAGEKYLHENGIIRGFGFDSINSLDNREIFYKGGIALVDGKVLAVNNTNVTIPQIRKYSDSLPATVLWAVCVNKYGKFEPIVITSTKEQFFATDGTSTYYIPSVTFTELIENRKDLTPISLVTAHIASFTLSDGDITDLRRFINYAGNASTFAPTSFSGHFHTIEATKNWVNNYKLDNSIKIKVRGNFTVSSQLDFRGFSKKVIFEGDGAIFNVTSAKGILLDANVKLKDISFNYNPTGITYTTNDRINSNNGCLYSNASAISLLSVEGCTFTSALATQRPPFISFEINNQYTVENVNISDCKFNDSSASPANFQAAISILSLNDDPINTFPSIVKNLNIVDNICNVHQGIYLIVNANSSGKAATPGILPVNVTISRNSCGIIGHLTTSQTAIDSGYVGSHLRIYGLVIDNNNCHIIANMTNILPPFATPGTFILNSADLLLFPGTVRIENNKLNWMYLLPGDFNSISIFNNSKIIGNEFRANDLTYLNNFLAVATTSSIALTLAQSTVYNQATVVVQNNTFDAGVYNGSTFYFYDYAILGTTSLIASENLFRGIATNGTYLLLFSLGGKTVNANIINNHFYRSGISITNYISLLSVSTIVGQCTDNFFDSTTINGSSTAIINSDHPVTIIVERNKNQTETYYLSPYQGIQSAARYTTTIPLLSGVTTSTLKVALGAFDTVFIRYTTGETSYYNWRISLYDILPKNVTILSATLSGTSTVNIDTGTFVFTARSISTAIGTPATISFSGGYAPNAVVTGTISDINKVNTAAFSVNLELATPAGITDAASMDITFTGITVTYRW